MRYLPKKRVHGGKPVPLQVGVLVLAETFEAEIHRLMIRQQLRPKKPTVCSQKLSGGSWCPKRSNLAQIPAQPNDIGVSCWEGQVCH